MPEADSAVVGPEDPEEAPGEGPPAVAQPQQDVQHQDHVCTLHHYVSAAPS